MPVLSSKLDCYSSCEGASGEAQPIARPYGIRAMPSMATSEQVDVASPVEGPDKRMKMP